MVAAGAGAQERHDYGPQLEDVSYPYPVNRFQLGAPSDEISMTYIDVRPQKPNGRTAVLLHGANFCAAAWEETIKLLAEQGFRVIAPEQLGFCKASKPPGYQFTIQSLAAHTHTLLSSLGISARARVASVPLRACPIRSAA